jgi:hypothetical protein
MTMPLTGPEAEKNDCYIVQVYQDTEPVFFVQEVHDHHFTGRWMTDGRNTTAASIPFSWIKSGDIRITHYFGLYIIGYGSFWKYVITGISGLYPVGARVHRLYEALAQAVFNRKKLVTVQRLQMLRVLVDHYVESGGEPIQVIDLMDKLYSIRWIMHPRGDAQQRKVELYMESLVDSGEVQKKDMYCYQVTGKAISTITRYEEEERRHKQNSRLQLWIVILTAALVGVGIMQAIVSSRTPSPAPANDTHRYKP